MLPKYAIINAISVHMGNGVRLSQQFPTKAGFQGIFTILAGFKVLGQARVLAFCGFH